jgi:hypothetical protein
MESILFVVALVAGGIVALTAVIVRGRGRTSDEDRRFAEEGHRRLAGLASLHAERQIAATARRRPGARPRRRNTNVPPTTRPARVRNES